jgi:hypothetical protein
LIEKNFPRTGMRCNIAAAMCETETEFGTNYSSIAIAGTPAHLAFGLLRWDTACHGTQRTIHGHNYATSVQRPDGTSDVVGNTVLLSDKVVRHTEEVASTGNTVFLCSDQHATTICRVYLLIVAHCWLASIGAHPWYQ